MSYSGLLDFDIDLLYHEIRARVYMDNFLEKHLRSRAELLRFIWLQFTLRKTSSWEIPPVWSSVYGVET
jgi:hypothetical protein